MELVVEAADIVKQESLGKGQDIFKSDHTFLEGELLQMHF